MAQVVTQYGSTQPLLVGAPSQHARQHFYDPVHPSRPFQAVAVLVRHFPATTLSLFGSSNDARNGTVP